MATLRKGTSHSWAAVEVVADGTLLAAQEDGTKVLQRLAKEYRVCAENPAGWLNFDAARSHIGFTVELCGSHDPGIAAHDRECRDCQCLAWALRTIASYVLPTKSTGCQRDPSCIHAIRLTSGRGEPHVARMSVVLVHSTEMFAAEDGCEVTCVDELRGRLRNLGIRESRCPSGQEWWA
jgi:hypothetical protein